MSHRPDSWRGLLRIYLLLFPRFWTFCIEWFAILFLIAWQWKPPIHKNGDFKWRDFCNGAKLRWTWNRKWIVRPLPLCRSVNWYLRTVATGQDWNNCLQRSWFTKHSRPTRPSGTMLDHVWTSCCCSVPLPFILCRIAFPVGREAIQYSVNIGKIS